VDVDTAHLLNTEKIGLHQSTVVNATKDVTQHNCTKLTWIQHTTNGFTCMHAFSHTCHI